MKESAASQAGVKHAVTNEETVRNEGGAVAALETTSGVIKGLKFQVAKVSKPLCSVAAITKAGHRVVFDEAGGFIQNKAIGEQILLEKENDVYVLNAKILTSAVAEMMGPGRQEG